MLREQVGLLDQSSVLARVAPTAWSLRGLANGLQRKSSPSRRWYKEDRVGEVGKVLLFFDASLYHTDKYSLKPDKKVICCHLSSSGSIRGQVRLGQLSPP